MFPVRKGVGDKCESFLFERRRSVKAPSPHCASWYQGDRASLDRLPGEPRFLDQMRGDATVDYAEHTADHGRAGWGCSWRAW